MWRKENSKPQAVPDAPGNPAPSVPHPTAAAPAVSPNAAACVSQGITIKGDVSGREDLFIDGTLQGKIRISGGTVTIGPNGTVNAEIEAREIVVRGEVTGSLTAEDRVQIWGSGRAIGDVRTRRIAIEDGAVLRGKVEILSQRGDSRGSRPEISAPAKEKEPLAVGPAQIKQ